ncbi:hypothetical protein [Nonomuraea sp. NPDC049158]|uniref:hypothetical protein n=1 Tax=Nonomuraea sp. NPDC049158 TaxID=3155649 RepID=UPI0033CAF06C
MTHAWGNPSLVRSGTTTAIAVRSQDNSLYYYWKRDQDAGWSGDQVEQDGVITSDASMARDSTATAIVVRDSANGLRYYRNLHGTQRWFMTPVAPSGSIGVADPQLANDGTTSSIVSQAPNGEVTFWWKPNTTGSWTPVIIEWPNLVGRPALSRDTRASRIVAMYNDLTKIKYYRSFHGQNWQGAYIYLH